MRYALVLALALMSGAGSDSRAVQRGASPCSFRGPDVEQAKCLLRRVRKYGEVDREPATLPPSLERLIGRETAPTVTAESLARYLAANRIREEDIGGPLSRGVSRTSGGAQAAYFIIHDTSDPPFERLDPFPPAGMNTPAWTGNDFQRYLHPTDCRARRRNPRARCEPVAHVFVNRVGQSVTGHDFSQGWRSTQYENQSTTRRGLFLAVENIQPRRKDARGIDAEAPDPGFTDAQMDRLALVYVAASVRRGRWLIPAFHGVMDIGVGTHDDPQNFDLGRWAERLNALLQSIR
jgi:hypothetical protein